MARIGGKAQKNLNAALRTPKKKLKVIFFFIKTDMFLSHDH